MNRSLMPLCVLFGGLACAAESPTVMASKADFLAEVDAHFAAWDADHDGTVTAAEISAVVADGSVTGKTAAAAAALKRTATNRKATPPTLTQESIHQLVEAPPGKDSPNLGAMYAYGLRKIARASRVLFSSGKPSLDTVHQGKMGNCFTLAPLGAMLNRDAGETAALFSALPDGGAEVRFGAKKVRVRTPTDGELAIISSNESDGLWVNLYERAAGELRNEAKPEEQRSADDLDAISGGGSAGTMLSLLTGHNVERVSLKFSKDPKLTDEAKAARVQDLRGKIESAVKARRLMTCGTVEPTTPGITPHHAYAVLGFDPANDRIRLWNPHGDAFRPKGDPGPEHGYVRKDGVFEMPLGAFVEQFSGIAFERS